MAMKKKMKGNITSPALPGKSILAEVNNNEAGNIYNSLFAKNRKVEYDNKYIALVNIRTNPDNQIFRVMDDDEDIRILAEDIKRNGLMHNLVVFPEQREEGMVYVLLSGERRFRALNYLQEKHLCLKMKEKCYCTAQTCRSAADSVMKQFAARRLRNLSPACKKNLII